MEIENGKVPTRAPVIAVAIAPEAPLPGLRAVRALRRLRPQAGIRYPAAGGSAVQAAALREPVLPPVVDASWLAGSDVLLLPRIEASLRSSVERALASGIPVVAPDSPETREALGMGGLLVERAQDWPGILAAIDRLQGDRSEREAVVRRGLAQARRLARRHALEGGGDAPPRVEGSGASPAAKGAETAGLSLPPEVQARPRLPVVDRGRTYPWGVAIGAWGDSLAACGNALEVLRQTGRQQIGMLYYGFYPEVREFLEAQPWCREAIHVRPTERAAYDRMVVVSCQSAAEREAWLPVLLAGTGVDPEEVALTHVDYSLQIAPVIHHWGPAALPARARRWAAEHLPPGGEKPVLLHPVSTQSNREEQHWPLWKEAIEWLLEETEYSFLLTGHGWEGARFGRHPRLVNLVNQTPSMLEVLALAERSRLVISTANCLSMWSLIQGLPAVVALNAGINEYFHQWIDAAPNRLVPRTARLSSFQAAYREATGVGEATLAGRECPLCGGPGAPFGEKGGLSLRECRCHGAVLLSWQWRSVEEYEGWYREAALPYHAAHQEAQGLPPMWERDGEYLQAASVRLRILAGLFPQVRSVLDVGAGTGAWVSVLRAHGYEAGGYEPSPSMVEAAGRRGRRLEVGGWEEVPLSERAPDLITLHDVLEHLPDPQSCLRRLRKLMGPTSLLCVEMPEWDCPRSRVEGMGFRHVRPREHLALYSETAAVELFRHAGLQVVAMVRPLEGALGKIAYYLKQG
jgi:SAM-dependent methyltransferase